MATGKSQPAEVRVLDTRSRILDAALSCFIESGYEHTTIARIRERSGVSNGALFHHFPTKEAIADALYVDAIESFQEGLWELLRSRSRSLRAALAGGISHQLRWIEANQDRARFLYMRGHLDWDSPASAQLQELNRSLAQAYREWMAPLVESGEVRAVSVLPASGRRGRARRRRHRGAQRHPHERQARSAVARPSGSHPPRARVRRR